MANIEPISKKDFADFARQAFRGIPDKSAISLAWHCHAIFEGLTAVSLFLDGDPSRVKMLQAVERDLKDLLPITSKNPMAIHQVNIQQAESARKAAKYKPGVPESTLLDINNTTDGLQLIHGFAYDFNLPYSTAKFVGLARAIVNGKSSPSDSKALLASVGRAVFEDSRTITRPLTTIEFCTAMLSEKGLPDALFILIRNLINGGLATDVNRIVTDATTGRDGLNFKFLLSAVLNLVMQACEDPKVSAAVIRERLASITREDVWHLYDTIAESNRKTSN